MTDENTTAAGTENSETTSTRTTSDQSTTSSNTQPLDLAGGDSPGNLGDDTGTGEETKDERTPEQVAADEARSEFYGAPAEGETYRLEGLPEGTVIDEEALKAIEPKLRALNLSSKGASELISTYAETVLPRVATQVQDQLQQQVLATRKTWEAEARQAIAGKNEKGEPVVLKSGTGVDLTFDGLSEEKVMQVSARAIDRLAPPEFRAFLKETGLGQHPAMIALTYQAGKAIGEDTDAGGLGGSGGSGKPKTTAEKFYGN